MKMSEIVLYEDGNIALDTTVQGETIWLNQKQISILFDVNVPAVSKHLKNIFNSGELQEVATISKMETVQKEGKREIKRSVDHYNLDAIISIGYRVNSKKATQFRIWATNVLKDHIVQGYTINKE